MRTSTKAAALVLAAATMFASPAATANEGGVRILQGSYEDGGAWGVCDVPDAFVTMKVSWHDLLRRGSDPDAPGTWSFLGSNTVYETTYTTPRGSLTDISHARYAEVEPGSLELVGDILTYSIALIGEATLRDTATGEVLLRGAGRIEYQVSFNVRTRQEVGFSIKDSGTVMSYAENFCSVVNEHLG